MRVNPCQNRVSSGTRFAACCHAEPEAKDISVAARSTMEHQETPLLQAIRAEIRQFETNLAELRGKIDRVEELSDLSNDQRINLKEWRKDREKYESELKEARARERN